MAPPEGVVLEAPPPLRKSATLEELVRSTLTRSVVRLLDQEPIVRAGEDPEGVHRARVATRRLRSDLGTFAPVVDTEWSEPLRAELRWLGEQLGRVRDADVLLAQLATKAAVLAPDDRADAGALIDRLGEVRARDRSALLDAMASERYTSLLARLVEAAIAPRLRDRKGSRAAARTVAKLARRPAKRLRREVRRLPPVPLDTELHEVRKGAKQVRYALEAIAPIAGDRARRQAKAVADLQETLGDLQDAVVAAAWLRAAADDSEGTRAPFVAGRLAGAFDADRSRLRRSWHRVWKHAAPDVRSI